MGNLHTIDLFDIGLEKGKHIKHLPLFYQIFGQPAHKAPVVLVNHALTGNSQVIGENGWWNDLIGDGKTIDTSQYCIIAFNIPGNGFDGDPTNLIQNYKDFTAKDIAAIFWKGLQSLGITELFAAIGGSLGGGIAWEMAFLKPQSIRHCIPVATHWKATDWLIANVLVQDAILNNSKNPIHDARLHAMLLYRSPQSLKQKFNTEKEKDRELYQIESWLAHHGNKLQNRFQLPAYKLMNHLLKTIGETSSQDSWETFSRETKSEIHLVGINSDYFFTPDENAETYHKWKNTGLKISYHEIDSIHGHDAFLIEFEQLGRFLKPIFS
ncbi:alpha/beta fold hydrolase [Flavobacterium humi]|uniref:Alpha/beta fold hydrolase n=1 Tax=Flavobacterium humi TaxID=2562683 RepID=A0A4Z0L582_9FLAO|nr:alpha/beta fold hydrolase [Flavobacterium humi]TGD57394.1 alpha/beta fold hydrolase [Flavobacterium humi]